MGKRICFLCRVETKPLFEFPSDFETRAKWFKAVEHLCDTSTITEYSKLCFHHFEESCFKRGETRALLIRKAVPTIFNVPNMPWHQEYTDMMKSCRKTDKICQDSVKDQHSVEPIFLKTDELLDPQDDQDENAHTPSDFVLKKPFFRSVKTFMQGSRVISDVCRICFRSSHEDGIKLYEETLDHNVANIENMLNSVLPDLDLSVYAYNTICARCFEFLDYSYRLKNDWLLTEQKLQKILKTKRRKLNSRVDVVILMEDEEQKVANVAHDHPYELKVDNHMHSEEEIIYEVEKSTKKEGKHSSWGSGPYMCETCGCMYTHLKSFQRHLRHQKCQKVVKKKLPPKEKLPSKEKLPPQEKLPPKEKSKVMCEQCGHLSPDIKCLTKHLQTHGEYICALCKKQFANKPLLLRHISITHVGVLNWQCHFCGKRFASRKVLNEHLLFHNPKIPCETCGKKFATRPIMRLHARTHLKEIFNCEQCGKRFKFKMSLHNHMKTFHQTQQKVACEFCGKEYAKKVELRKHKLWIHGYSDQKSGKQVSVAQNDKKK